MLLSAARRHSGRNNEEMVDRFVEEGLISSKEVEDALRAIPRGSFVPNDQLDEAYDDSPLRGDPHIHMSAPDIYATVLEALDLCPGLSFLNIGSGTGYFSCLVGYIIKRNSINHGIEHYEDLVEYCKERCEEFVRYNPIVGNEMSQPVFLSGNCFRLDNRDRHYDRIYCGAACPPSKVPFVLSMTKVGGFAIIPCKNKLLKIDRISPAGVKQTVLKEVSFATLASLPSAQEGLPKLKFPSSGDRKKEKTLNVYPPSDLLISNGPTRKTLARLRALQRVTECLQASEPLPIPFCYVPDQQQLKELKQSKKVKETPKPSSQTHKNSDVDSKISFFTSWNGQTLSSETNASDKWDFLNSDRLWEKVVEHYYSVCSVSKSEKMKAMLLFTKKKAKKHSLMQNPSYAQLMSRIGLPIAAHDKDQTSSNETQSLRSDTGSSRNQTSSDETQSLRSDTVSSRNQTSSDETQSLRSDTGSSRNQTSSDETQSLRSDTGSSRNEAESPGNDTQPSSNETQASSNIAESLSNDAPLSSNESHLSGSKVQSHINNSMDGKEPDPSKLADTEKLSFHESTNGNDDCSNYTQENQALSSAKHCYASSLDVDDNAQDDDISLTVSSVDDKGEDFISSNLQVNEILLSGQSTKACNVTSIDSTLSTHHSKEPIGVTENYLGDETHGKAQTMQANSDQTKDGMLKTNELASGLTLESSEHVDGQTLEKSDQDCCNQSETTIQASDSKLEINNHDNTVEIDNQTPEETLVNTDKTQDSNLSHDISTSQTAETKRNVFKESKKSFDSDKKKSEYIDVLITIDNNAMKKLNSFPKTNWSLEDDKELVKFLTEVSDQSSKGRCKGWFKPELVRPSLFSRIDSLTYPRLSAISSEDLAYRIVGLCRVASILDSCLHLLTGPSLLNEYPSTRCKYPMDSFNDSSFVSSRGCKVVNVEQPPAESKQKVTEDTSEYSLMDADQLRVQLELTSKKLKLTQDLQDQIKEQQKVLKKQASLLEEKQLLIQNLSLLDIQRQQSGRPQSSEQQAVIELKTQRQDVLSRIQKLGDQFALQETKKAELVDELKHVKEERNRVINMEKRKKSQEPSTSVEEHQHVVPSPKQTEQRHTALKESSRYEISSLLPHLRFLLPLCQRRWRLVQEMLHASECSAPDHLPIVTIDRRVPLCERGGRTDCSVLLQVYKELKSEGLNYRWNKRKYDQWWEVKFIGEGIIDQGGGFRDSLVEIADEICPSEKNCPEVQPYFIRTPNNKDGVGEYQDTYIPTPFRRDWHVYEWIGKLFGAAYRSDENLTVSCPPFFWKLLVGEHVTWSRDYAAIDQSAVTFTDALEAEDEELYDAAYGADCTFSTILSNGKRIDLIPHGEDNLVKSADRKRFARLLREARMTEFVKQVLSIRQGLISVVPEAVLRLLTWDELERGVCGNPDVSLSVLKNSCKYGDDLSESTECIKHFWSALAKFTNEERSKFLRFVTGRRRPPAPFTVVKAGGSNELPNASTCASSLFWPSYSSTAMATARLRYAIYNCIAIDTDTSPW